MMEAIPFRRPDTLVFKDAGSTMFAPIAHFSLTETTDPGKHDEERELYQLYHLPELLSQPGVAWGERWQHDAECAALDIVREKGVMPHHLSMCWLRAPVRRNAFLFRDHFVRADRIGLSSRTWTRDIVDDFLVPLKGYVRHDRLVSADALPFRPSKGVYLMVSRFADHRGPEAEDIYRWYDQVRIPDLLDCPGAAGAWTFASRHLFIPDGDQSRPVMRITLVYLESDPVEFAAAIAARRGQWARTGRERDTSPTEEALFAGPFRAVDPWKPARFAASEGNA
jgi:hypothetical protein